MAPCDCAGYILRAAIGDQVGLTSRHGLTQLQRPKGVLGRVVAALTDPFRQALGELPGRFSGRHGQTPPRRRFSLMLRHTRES
jgi:hypothetical protein